jgi:hypothetical protein
MRIKISVTVLLSAFLLAVAELSAQSFSGGFNFYLPPSDTATQKFLPSFPVIPISNFISINNEGHFVSGELPIRFWGANIVSGAAFPDTANAWFIAGRLRKTGFNLIRFHHIDNGWGNESLFDYNSNTRHLNADRLNRMEYLIAGLKKNGIYVNMNLNVSRSFKEADGVSGADSLSEFAKGVTQFDPYLIELQKEYAAQLLTHVNPYTGLALVNDPVMAMVEITNENSLYRIWRDNRLKSFADGGQLIHRHVRMLDSAWNKFLSDKYTTAGSLAAAWNQGTSTGGQQNQVKNSGFEKDTTSWEFEKHEGTSAMMLIDSSNAYAGAASVKLNILKTTGTAWHLQWKQKSLSVKKDSLYSVIFAARADRNLVVTAGVMRDNDPYTYYSGSDFTLTQEWKIYSFTFKAPEENVGYGRLTFQFTQTGTCWFDEISLGSPVVEGLLAGETIEAGNIRRIDFSERHRFSDNRVKDMSGFYITLQKRYFNMMKEYLVNTLGVKVPVVGTNWNTGPADLSIQDEMDYIDNHAYFDHPNFPNIPWSSYDWNIVNISMAGHAEAGTIPYLFSGIAKAGKPYTISEYNHPFPNRYQSEAPLFIAAYSSFHDADGIMFFEYNSANEWVPDKISSYFSIHRNNVMMALMPSCAYAFRNKYISGAKETLLIDYTDEDIKLMPKNDNGQWDFSLLPRKLSLIHAVRNNSFNSSSTTDFSSLPGEPSNPYKTDTEEITYNTNGLLTVDAPKFAGITGHINTFPSAKAGSMTIKTANGFGAVTWISLTGDSLSSAEKSLITVSSKIQNTSMIWDGTTTIHDHWGTAPTQVFPLNLTLELNVYADSIRIYPLGTKGEENINSSALYYPVRANTFEVVIDQSASKTLWYGLEKYGNGVTDVKETSALPAGFYLGQNYPNPFNPSTNFNFTIPVSAGTSLTTLRIYDVLGKEVATVINRELSPGKYNITYSVSDNALASGVYYYTLRSGEFTKTKKMVVLK